ncbi:TIR domain-containing protein [Pseudomonas anguilliseptica]|uniref:TIR domain-containing protein n=1 Tax=Pseudomonas anguilliseptica TaxID=53406 RepID=UPI003736FFF5
MSKKKLEDIFKLSGIPEHTFVEPKEYPRLYVALRTHGRGVVIEGPSGIGKTTCVLNVLHKLGIKDNVKILSGRKRKDSDEIQKLLDSDGFGTVIIDDFHKLDGSTKKGLSDLLKTLADEEVEGSKLVLVGINKTGHSLIEYSSDLRNRIDIIKFEANSEEKIEELLTKGEAHLKIDLAVKSEIISDSQGSFHLAQMLAHHACLRSNIFEECTDLTSTSISFETLKEFILDDLSISFSSVTVKFCKGQRVKKGSRAPYLHVLYWLSSSESMSINIDSTLIENQNHKNSVGQILTKGHLREHFESDPKYSDILFYNYETTELSAEDPKFFYYIKNISWSKLAKKIGFHALEFTSAYDYALSFAGSERVLAEYIYQKLSENEISVFYDNNEQARILSQDVEEYLAPIYRSESRFIVPILSLNYPSRIWCKFEAENFKQRFGEKSVIPLWLSNCPPGMFDLSNGTGGFTFDIDKGKELQLDNFAELLIEKIHQIRLEEKS